jgi:diguanylate cyclase (GGDEF)-like protein
MAVSSDSLDAYGQLFTRLLPRLAHAIIVSADGKRLWSSGFDAESVTAGVVSAAHDFEGAPRRDPDGAAEGIDTVGPKYAFRLRGMLDEIIAIVAVAVRSETNDGRSLAAVHALLRPGLVCLQRELCSRTSIGELTANLRDHGRDIDLFQRLHDNASGNGIDGLTKLAELTIEAVPGTLTAILLPDRNVAICRVPGGIPRGKEAEALTLTHRHLVTRAQLHGRSLVANRLVCDGQAQVLPYKVLSTPIRDSANRVAGVIAVFRNDTDADFKLREVSSLELLARKAGQILQMSFDPVTGMLTRGAFLEHVEGRAAVDAATAGAHGMMYVDIDQLHVVNENHGMHIGDEVIQRVAELMRSRGRLGVLSARLGSDRFAMFLPNCGIEPAARVAEELRSAAMRLSAPRGDKPLVVALSIGVARIAAGGARPAYALAAAEAACRLAKERGGNRVEIYQGGDNGAGDFDAEQGMALRVRQALAEGAFELVAQPILPLGRAPTEPRFEIFLRMRAADGTRLSPSKFMHAAGIAQLQPAVDRWVIEQTLAQLRGIAGDLARTPARFSVNISAASLADPDFWPFLEQSLTAAELAPGTLCLEFPEEAIAAHLGQIETQMLRQKARGVSFALDDFGAGASSLQHLTRLPISAVKIDGIVLRDLLTNPHSQAIVTAVAELGKVLGLETIAENVETDAIRARAAELGLGYGQGFFIGKPVPLEEVLRDLPMYACFATSTGLFDRELVRAVAESA